MQILIVALEMKEKERFELSKKIGVLSGKVLFSIQNRKTSIYDQDT